MVTHTPLTTQAWSRISVPISGSEAELLSLQIAAHIAEAFDSELNVLFAPPDPAELAPWLGEGFMGTVQMSTLESLRTASDDSLSVAAGAIRRPEPQNARLFRPCNRRCGRICSGDAPVRPGCLR